MPDLSLVRFVLLSLTFSLLFELVLDRKFAKQAKNCLCEFALPVGLLAVFFCWRIVSSLFAPSGAFAVIGAIRDSLYFIVPFIAALITIKSSRDVKMLATVLIMSAAISAILGVVEYGTGFSLYASLTEADSIWNTFNQGREFKGVLSTFSHPLAFGSYLVVGLIFSMLLFIGNTGFEVKLFTLIAIVSCFAGIIASTSRGALASLAAAIAWLILSFLCRAYYRVRKAQRAFAIIVIIMPAMVVLFGAITLVGFSLVKGSSAEQTGSSMVRVLQVQLGIPLIGERPVLGYGVGKAAETLALKAETVDIYYLTLALECGMVGLLIFLVIMTYFVYSSTRSFFLCRNPNFMVIAMFFVAESTQMLVLSLKQTLPMLYVGFALLLKLQKLFNSQCAVVRGGDV